MERPKAPKGWELSEFHYKGEMPEDYDTRRMDEIVFSLRRGEFDRVVLIAFSLFSKGKVTSSMFGVYRSNRNVTGEGLDPDIKNFRDGVEYCTMVAEKYIDRPKSEIPRSSDKRAIEKRLMGVA